MSIESNNQSKLRQAKSEEEKEEVEKLLEKKRLFPRNSLLFLRLHCSPVRPNSPKTFQTNENRTAQTSDELTFAVFPYNRSSMRRSLKVFSLGSSPDCCPPNPSSVPSGLQGEPGTLESQMKATPVAASIPRACCCGHAAPLHAKDTDNIYHGSTPAGGSYLRGCCGSHREICGKEKEEKRGTAKIPFPHLAISNYKQR